MELLFYILFVISVPVFYILGAIDFFKTIFGKKNSSTNNNYYNRVTNEINHYLKNHPHAKATDLLSYFEKLEKGTPQKKVIIHDESIENQHQTTHSEIIIPIEDKEVEEAEKQLRREEKITVDFWQNWYAENSINLLLYVGAFLIVASASIFVGFQWESIGQEIKAILLSLLTLSFFIAGFAFFQNKKVRNAGITFSAIGALLIPLTGLGWYNFVLKNMGVSEGLTWFITSLIAVSIYIGLGIYFKSRFYGYVTSLALWSLSLSIVSLSGLAEKYYILASILSNFILLTLTLFLKDKNDELKPIITEPLEISTNILMPLTLIYGLSLALAESLFSTLEVSLSLFLASCYYYLYYSFSQKIWQLALSLSIFPIFLMSFFSWRNMADQRLFYTEFILGLADIGIAYTMLKNKLDQPALASTAIGLIIIILSFISMLAGGFGLSHNIAATILLGATGIITYYVHQKYEFLHITAISLLFLVYFIVHDLLNLPSNQLHLLGLIYLFLGASSFILSYLLKTRKQLSLVFIALTILSLILAFLFSISNQYAILTCLVSFAAIFLAGSYFYQLPILIYPSNLFITLSILQIIYINDIQPINQPYIYSILGIAYYAIHFLLINDEERQTRYKYSGLITSLITPIYFGLPSIFSNNLLEQSALISAYLTTLLFGYESTRTKDSAFRYFTSAVTFLTLLWQIKVLNFENLQIYTIPSAIYFLLLAFTRKLKDDKSGEEMLNVIGLGILFLSSLSQALSDNGAYYALLLGIEGIIILLLGISTNNKLFRLTAILAIILAVISQTYSYLFNLPKWLITGLAGLIFLAVAVFLLTKRSDKDDS